MRFTLKTDDLVKGLAEAETEAARSVTGAMREVTEGLKSDLRADVVDGGLGQRLANTWRGKTYPEGAVSLEAALVRAASLINAVRFISENADGDMTVHHLGRLFASRSASRRR